MDKNAKAKFLRTIAMLESSGGRDIDHKPIESGLQQGQQAIGKYGLLPNTVQELINRRRQSGEIESEIEDLNQLDQGTLRDRLEQNPDLQEKLADQLAERVISRQQGDLDKAAYSWNRGHNLTPDRISLDKLNSNDYVQKFRNLMNQLNQNKN